MFPMPRRSRPRMRHRRCAFFARELGVDLAQVTGSGPKGRILQEDVQNFVKASLSGRSSAPRRRRCDHRRRRAESSAVAAGRLHQVRSDRGETPLADQEGSRARNLARKLGDDPARHAVRRRRHHRARSVSRAPQQGEREGRRQSDDAGVPDQGQRRRAPEIPRIQRLAGRRQPRLQALLQHRLRRDTPNGLVVPVIKGADQKGVLAIAKEMGELSSKAREGKLGPAEMQGGCSRSARSAASAAPRSRRYINAPEVAILGVSRSATPARLGRWQISRRA